MPLIQLNFPNPLNTSVQVGDTAYFSNPYPIAPPPVSPRDWASTVTPHLTNEKEDIKKIGSITEIIPWNNVFSAIICDMPQDLFNQYFSEINLNMTCVPPPNPSGYTVENNQIGVGRDCFDAQKFNAYPSVGPQSPLNRRDIVVEGFQPGNHNTLFQDIGVFGTPINPSAPAGGYVGGELCVDAEGENLYMITSIWAHNIARNEYGCQAGMTSAHAVLDFVINGLGWSGLTMTSSWGDLQAAALISGNNPPPGRHVGGSGNAAWSNPTSTGAAAPCRCIPHLPICTGGSFIMFSKDNKVNLSSILGYYASVEFRNSSQEKAELFTLSAIVEESSK